ncbi:MAG TPA: hypothetical protein VF582_07035 [Allosphingosinicella sp.]|jgi:hypothetical protein
MSPQVHEAVKDDLERLETERSKPWAVRMADWIGRLHPFAVHFPLALFPISWVALVLGRRRVDAEPLLRSLIIVAGASAAVASALGWINGGFALAGADPLLLWHRWVGTGLAVAGGGSGALDLAAAFGGAFQGDGVGARSVHGGPFGAGLAGRGARPWGRSPQLVVLPAPGQREKERHECEWQQQR